MIASILLNKEIFFVLSDKSQCIQKTAFYDRFRTQVRPAIVVAPLEVEAWIDWMGTVDVEGAF